MRVLVPTAGRRNILLATIRELDAVEKLVTTEIDPLAPGLVSADASYRVPRNSEPGYMDAIKAICRMERIDLLFPLADLDLARFAGCRDEFAALGVTVFACPQKTLDLALDKFQTFELLRDMGIPTPATCLFSDTSARTYPLYLKPRHAGMKSTPSYFFSLLEDEHDHAYFARKLAGHEDDYLLQEYVGAGREINVDFFVQDGDLKRVVTLYRTGWGAGGGITRGSTFPCPPQVHDIVERLVAKVDFHGPANIQMYDNDGALCVTEINARFSNSSALNLVPAGVNYYELALRMLAGETIEAEFDNYESMSVTCAYLPVIADEDGLQDTPGENI